MEYPAAIADAKQAAGHSFSPELLALRDHVFEETIGLPLDF